MKLSKNPAGQAGIYDLRISIFGLGCSRLKIDQPLAENRHGRVRSILQRRIYDPENINYHVLFMLSV